jgi:cell division protein FtsW (lipid II flippase)
MDNWIDYLSANPVLALALVVVLVLFLFMVLRKLIKWAIISFVILVVAVGFSYSEAQKQPQIIRDLIKNREKVFKEGEKAAEKTIDKLKKSIKDKSFK